MGVYLECAAYAAVPDFSAVAAAARMEGDCSPGDEEIMTAPLNAERPR